MSATFPQDDSGDVLRRMQSKGDALTKPRDIDFVAIFADENAVESFAGDVRELGYRVEVERGDVKPQLPWDARVIRNMIPTYEAITEFENVLEGIASKYGGQNDGWGCITQTSTNAD